MVMVQVVVTVVVMEMMIGEAVVERTGQITVMMEQMMMMKAAVEEM